MVEYASSPAYQGFWLSLTIAYALGWGAVMTGVLLYMRMGNFKYHMGKRSRAGSVRPHYGHDNYWYRWLVVPSGWLPTWAWMLLLFIVWGLWGCGWGLFGWIVNDYAVGFTSSSMWLTIVSFMLIVPVLAGMWAIAFFFCQYLGWALIGSVLVVLASVVQFGMTISYAVLYPATSAVEPATAAQYVTYQWLAFAFAAPQFVFYIYVLAMNVMIYLANRDRDMDNDLAPDEEEEERVLVEAKLDEMDTIMGAAIGASDTKMAVKLRTRPRTERALLGKRTGAKARMGRNNNGGRLTRSATAV